MNSTDKLHRIAELFEKVVKKEFPEMTDASISVDDDGYLYLSIEVWEKANDKPVEKRLRRMLVMDARFTVDQSWKDTDVSGYNKHLDKKGILLKGEKSA